MIRRGVPFTIAFTFLTFGFQVLFERLCEWETLIPKAISLLQISHLAMVCTSFSFYTDISRLHSKHYNNRLCAKNQVFFYYFRLLLFCRGKQPPESGLRELYQARRQRLNTPQSALLTAADGGGPLCHFVTSPHTVGSNPLCFDLRQKEGSQVPPRCLGAGVRWTPLQSRSTDRGGSRDGGMR